MCNVPWIFCLLVTYNWETFINLNTVISISDMSAMALQNVMCVLSPSDKGKVPITSWKEGNTAPTRIRRSEAELTQAAECVQKGMTFQNVSDAFNIPISTIRFYMARRGILPQRRRGRTSSTQQPNSGSSQFMMMHYKLEDINKKQSTQWIGQYSSDTPDGASKHNFWTRLLLSHLLSRK